MTERLFMISVDWDDPALDADGFRSFIRESNIFSNWWNHIPTLFLVTSSVDAETISAKLRKYSGNANLLVMEVNPRESEGLLPKLGWHWIRRRSGESLTLSEA